MIERLSHVSPHVPPDTTTAIQFLLAQGKLGTALVFQTGDCRQTAAGLAAKGVTIVSLPTEDFHGIEATFTDNSGNGFTLHQPLGLAVPH